MSVQINQLMRLGFWILIGFLLPPADLGIAQETPTGPQTVAEALSESGLRLTGTPPKEMDLDGDGEAEYIGQGETRRRYGGKRLSAFFIVGKDEEGYKVLYQLIGNFSVIEGSLVDFNNDAIQDYFLRYGNKDFFYGTVLLWNKPPYFKRVYLKKAPHSFHLTDLDQDGYYEIIQIAPPYSGPKVGGPVEAWQWRDIYRWDKDKQVFVKDNSRFRDFYIELKKDFENTIERIEAKDIPEYDWLTFEESFLELKQRIETDYLERIEKITKHP